MITASGVGSGIDIESIITQLMEFERQPVDSLNEKRAQLDVELSSFGRVKSAMNELASAGRTLGSKSDLAPFVGTSSNEEVLTVSANDSALSERHDIEVLAVATQHRVNSKAYDSADAAVASQTRTITSGENTFEVTTDNTNSTLNGLRDAINAAPENQSVDASIINVDGGSRLVLTARIAGTANTIEVTGGGLLAQAEFSELNKASDAELIIDGFAVTRSSNDISDVISGVTISLVGTGKVDIGTQRNKEGLRENMDIFVEKYNALRTVLNAEAESDLQGDRLPRNADSALRAVFSQPIELANGETTSALQLGFNFDRYGVLSIDSSEYSEATSTNMERFIEAFTMEESGVARQFEDVLEGYTQAGGVISSRESGIGDRKGRIDDQIERYDYRLEKTEARYRRQYGSMDALVGQLNNTSSYLASQLTPPT